MGPAGGIRDPLGTSSSFQSHSKRITENSQLGGGGGECRVGGAGTSVFSENTFTSFSV